MKKIILYLFLFLITSTLIAQNSLEVHYDVITNINHLYKTTGVLKIHNNKSHYIVLKTSDGFKKKTKKRVNGNLNITLPDSDNRPQVFTDINKKLLLSGYTKTKSSLKEKLPKINWKITDEFKEIGKYKCQKATGYFRGRTYTTWFTNKVPVPFGPWKLQGLPGLIIEVKDDKKEVYFRVRKVSFKDTVTINNFPNEEKAIPLREYVDVIIPNKKKELIAKMNAKSDRHTTIIATSTDRNSTKEIIYEWEEKKEK